MHVTLTNPMQIGVSEPGATVSQKASAAAGLVAGSAVGGIPAAAIYGVARRMQSKWLRAGIAFVGNVALAAIAGYMPGRNFRVGAQAAALGTAVSGALVEAFGWNPAQFAQAAQAKASGAAPNDQVAGWTPGDFGGQQSMIPALAENVGTEYVDYVGADYSQSAGALPHDPYAYTVGNELIEEDYAYAGGMRR